jgi:hypothetical protein
MERCLLTFNPDIISTSALSGGVVAQDGWSRESLQKMVKLGTFAKGSQRLWGIAPGKLVDFNSEPC